jgi:glutamate/tyrosine decarboxylase-like PLP-dependent enzyme
VASTLRAPEDAVVTLTAGGTESNLLAVRAARNRARVAGRVDARRIVVPYTAHPSFDKSADFMDLEIVRVPVGSDYRADLNALAKELDERTLLVVGSAPSYTHGVADPIRELAEVASAHGAWMHVDACVGGFLHPFLRQLGHELPDFDLSIPAVDSVSADLHKFGHAPHGISSLTVRSRALFELQRYAMDDWPFGYYGTAGLLGTRPGGIVAGAWAVMVHLGNAGYLDLARRIAANATRLAAGVREIDGIEPLNEPELGIVSIVGSATVSIPELAEAMWSRGWPTFWSAEPRAIHLLSEPVEPELVERYLTDLAAAAADVAAGRITTSRERATYATDVGAAQPETGDSLRATDDRYE